MPSSSETAVCPSVDQTILKGIDQIQLSDRLKRERDKFFQGEVEITSERAVLAMEWWKETEGDVLDIRWAKLVRKWTEELPIVIFKDQLIAGSETKLFRGVDPWVECEAPMILEIMEKDRREMKTSAVRVSRCSEEDWAAIAEAVDFFMGKTAVDLVFKGMQSLYGDWPEELEKARGIMRHGRYAVVPPIPQWEKLSSDGLEAVIREAQAGIERVRSGEEPDAKKAWFWEAVVIVCKAIIHYAHRYAQLARDLARNEPNPVRRKELEQIAESCDRVPERPARTLHEALQSRVLFGVAMKWCQPNIVGDESGRMDQYLYPYFMKDLGEGRLRLEQASDLIGTVLSNLSRRDGVKNALRGQYAQGTLLNNVTIGGVTQAGNDANNELTYLILHMAGLLKYAEPHYSFRTSASTPRWVLLKALDTNRKVGGGQPQFMSDDHVINYMLTQGEDLANAREWMGDG